MSKRIIFFALYIVSVLTVFSQAGYGVYQFLDLPVSSRQAALGGANISVRDNDMNFAFQNPALLTSNTSGMINLNIANYLADIKFGSAMYGFSVRNKNYFGVGVQYVDYGDFLQYSELNVPEGEFTAKDMALNIVYARPLTDKITVGATLKPVFSVYEVYTSFGVAMDAGISYYNPAKLFGVGFVLRNAGAQFQGYYKDEDGQHYEPLPFNIQLGATKKLTHAPFRFSLTLHNLQRWNLDYISDNMPSNSLTGETVEHSVSLVDMAFRHTIFGVEFQPGKNFYLAGSYNHRRHNELSMNGFKSMAGFSFGGGIKLSKFMVGFGMSQFQVGNWAYQFSISTDLKEFGL
ncbi:MAG: type IX secretion system protein PorQ [Paludibacteraceae bacterium]|nr:type IX secretion system protein PorQ [Paludibacteraceae bacterium]